MKRNKIDRAQISLLDEIIVDNFAGGGGASTGIEVASGKVVDIAINHDPDAIAMHKANHPYTKHLQTSVWDVDPAEVCEGRPVGLAWFSPDCKHFSKARGGVPVKKEIRSLAWVAVRWALEVQPRVIMLENVEEFKTWGPTMQVFDGIKWVDLPDPERAGETFNAFVGVLTDGIPADHPALDEICEYLRLKRDSSEIQRLVRGLGYKMEFKELVAADYGAPTTRKRFVLVARCDGKPIVWPERTHAPRDSAEVKEGKCKPWVSAAEIIDWSLPSYSIFASKAEIKEKYGVNAVRPLAENTLKRVIRGVDKFTIKSGKPFLVECNHSGGGHVRSAEEPVSTVTGKFTCGVVESKMAPFTFSNTGGSVGSPASGPVHTIRTAGGQILASANLIQYHTEQQSENARVSGLERPIQTVDASNRYGLATAQLVEYYSTGRPLNIESPLHTVTSHDREALVSAHIQKYFGGVVGSEISEPLPTVTAIDHNALCAAHIAEFKGSDIGQPVDKPLRTITASAGEFAEVRTKVVKYEPGAPLGYWPKVRELLNKHCGYDLKEDEILLLLIRGTWYFISDITLRMLSPKELYKAMGAPVDYIIDRDTDGRPYGKTKQVERCGNMVCPPMAAAMVRANFPEWCKGVEISTMAELKKAVAV